MTTSTREHRIYVASLTDYNNGILHGKWIDLDLNDESEVEAEIQEMLDSSPTAKKYGEEAEEWAIHDYEGIDCEEYTPISDIMEQMEIREEVGDNAWDAYTSLVGSDFATLEDFNDRYYGEWDSEEDYAYQLVEDCGYLDDCPEVIKNYFDYKSFTRDLFMNDMDSVEIEGKVHVFVC